jgi:hypothetical protein
MVLLEKAFEYILLAEKRPQQTRSLPNVLKSCPPGQFRFIQAKDLCLMRDVDRVCSEIIEAERGAARIAGQVARVDLLVMTQGIFRFGSRKGRAWNYPTMHNGRRLCSFMLTDTEEGLDMLPALLYYGRMRCIVQLLPLLLASPLQARVASVQSPGNERKIFPEDLSLRDPKHWSLLTSGSHLCYMTTFFMEQLAARHAGKLSLAHIYPGLVMTDLGTNSNLPVWFNLTWQYAIAPWAKYFAVPKMETGERLMFYTSPRFPARPVTGSEMHPETIGDVQVAVSTDGVLGGGFYTVNWNGETLPLKKTYSDLRKNGLSEKVWKHTMEAFKDIEDGKVFSG